MKPRSQHKNYHPDAYVFNAGYINGLDASQPLGEQATSPCSFELIQNYFLVIEHCFSLTTFQHKYKHKLNFSIQVRLNCFSNDYPI